VNNKLEIPPTPGLEVCGFGHGERRRKAHKEVAERDQDAITIRVYFELESRPPWFLADAAGVDDLHVAAEGLRRDLRRFPHATCGQAATSGAPSPHASVAAGL
jgi:hypothetical protein